MKKKSAARPSKQIDLRTISSRLGIEQRTLRYIAESGLVRGFSVVASQGTQRRMLAIGPAMEVAIVAGFHQAGIRGPGVPSLARKAVDAYIRESHGQATCDLEKMPFASIEIDLVAIHRKLTEEQ